MSSRKPNPFLRHRLSWKSECNTNSKNSTNSNNKNSNNPTNSIASGASVSDHIQLGNNSNTEAPPQQQGQQNGNHNNNSVMANNVGSSPSRRNKKKGKKKGNKNFDPRRGKERTNRPLEREIREKKCGIFSDNKKKMKNVKIMDIGDLPAASQEKIAEIIRAAQTNYEGRPVPPRALDGNKNSNKNGNDKDKEKEKDKDGDNEM